MTHRIRLIAAAAVVLIASAVLLSARGMAGSEEELGMSAGVIKVLTLPLEGNLAGKLYFEIVPTEQGAPSAFKVDVNNWAAIEMLTAARAAKAKIRVTYKADFSVTELEIL